jgi:hypothetical protein
MLVSLDSRGGDVMEALAIGREVRARFMYTQILNGEQCSSACVFILIAGVDRHAEFGKIGLHRPAFDPEYFANLSPSEARDRYNSVVETLQRYYVEEMGGSPEAFRLIMSTPSRSARYLSTKEIFDLNLTGQDPADGEYNDASLVQLYGRERWPVIDACYERIFKACAELAIKRSLERTPAQDWDRTKDRRAHDAQIACQTEANRGFDRCAAEAYRQYPPNRNDLYVPSGPFDPTKSFTLVPNTSQLVSPAPPPASSK